MPELTVLTRFSFGVPLNGEILGQAPFGLRNVLASIISRVGVGGADVRRLLRQARFGEDNSASAVFLRWGLANQGRMESGFRLKEPFPLLRQTREKH